jgi:hypothetical protein
MRRAGSLIAKSNVRVSGMAYTACIGECQNKYAQDMALCQYPNGPCN